MTGVGQGLLVTRDWSSEPELDQFWDGTKNVAAHAVTCLFTIPPPNFGTTYSR